MRDDIISSNESSNTFKTVIVSRTI